MEEQKIILTKKVKTNLQNELTNLINIQRPKVIEELKEARSQGDLSENADYDAARNHQATIETRITEIEMFLKKAVELKTNNSTKDNNQGDIKIGSKVVFHHSSLKKDVKMQILGPLEANPFKNIISNNSPIAKALLGHKEGDIVSVKTTQSSFKLKIKKVT